MNEQPVSYKKKLDSYLSGLETELAPLPASDRVEILAETRSHFLERLRPSDDVATFDGVAAQLGRPAEYARRFRDNYEINLALASGSVLLMLRKAASLVGLGVAAFFGFLSFAVLAGLSVTFVVLAALKPLSPDNIGLWTFADEFHLNFSYIEPGARDIELLGWWFIPVTLVLALLMYVALRTLLPRFLRFLGRELGPKGYCQVNEGPGRVRR